MHRLAKLSIAVAGFLLIAADSPGVSNISNILVPIFSAIGAMFVALFVSKGQVRLMHDQIDANVKAANAAAAAEIQGALAQAKAQFEGAKEQAAAQLQAVREQIQAQSGFLVKQHELDRVNAQLNSFYGPFLVITLASEDLYRKFAIKCGRSPEDFFNKDAEGNESKLDPAKDLKVYAAWIKQMRHVFRPLNKKHAEVVLNHAALVELEDSKEEGAKVEIGLPIILVKLVTHVFEFDSVIESWAGKETGTIALECTQEGGEKGVLQANTSFPGGLAKYATNQFKLLKEKQAVLLKKLEEMQA